MKPDETDRMDILRLVVNSIPGDTFSTEEILKRVKAFEDYVLDQEDS